MAERRCRDCNRLQYFGAHCDVCGGALFRDLEARDDEPPPANENERVQMWRLGSLLDAGYPPNVAERLAVNPEVDLRQAVGLVKRGCPPELAGRILL